MRDQFVVQTKPAIYKKEIENIVWPRRETNMIE